MVHFDNVLAGLVALCCHARLVAGHGYLREPPARNRWSSSKNGHCPHCGNGGGICGDGNQWPSWSNYYKTVKEPKRTYTAGEIVELDVSMDVNHMGHHEFFICDHAINSDTPEDIACLQKWPLMRVPPEELGLDCAVNDPREDCQPIDPNYPGRWYHIPGMSRHKIHYRIPVGLSCSHCTMQWFWPTANSAAYDVASYSCFAKQLKEAGWNLDFCGWECGDDKCPSPYVVDPNEPRAPDPAKTSGFEEFRNCADIKVLAGGPTPAPKPAPPTLQPTSLPTASPSAMPPGPSPTAPASKELVAFVENWLPCPSLEKIKGYTKVVVSFAVTYTWNPTKNVCSSACQIAEPAICANSPQAGLVQSWQAAGTKVLLSFGGAGMGGSWAGDVNDCWEYCFDRVDSVVSQLTQIVNTQGFDGVDIDYEYFHTSASSAFLKDLTRGLRQRLGSSKIISHAPMDGDIAKGRPYFNVLQDVASSIDYVLPQYYNGPYRPANDVTGALNHMGDLISDIFDGDQSKVVFGFCIADCSGTGSNVNSQQAVAILNSVNAAYPNHGGAFLWAASDDNGWSGPVAGALGLAGDLNPNPGPAPSPPTPEQGGGSCSGEPCADSSMCRSEYGYCGATPDYCNDKSTWTSSGCGGTPGSPTPTPTPAPTHPQAGSSCTGEPCPDQSMCRSQWGWCGVTANHCNDKSTWKSEGCGTDRAAPTPLPTYAPPKTSCVPIGDCGAEEWCNQELFVAHCREAGTAGACPSPFCEQAALAQDTAPRRLRASR